jgi:hypothetical protein
MSVCVYSRQPVLAGLFSASIYAKQRLPHTFVPDADQKPKYLPPAMRRSSEMYACHILEQAALNGSNAAFDEFVYYGIDEEDVRTKQHACITKQHAQLCKSRTAMDLTPGI